VIGYPIITAGLLLATVAAALCRHDAGGRMMRYIEARTLIIGGLSLTCLSLFYHDLLDRPDRRSRDRDLEHRAGLRVWPRVSCR